MEPPDHDPGVNSDSRSELTNRFNGAKPGKLFVMLRGNQKVLRELVRLSFQFRIKSVQALDEGHLLAMKKEVAGFMEEGKP